LIPILEPSSIGGLEKGIDLRKRGRIIRARKLAAKRFANREYTSVIALSLACMLRRSYDLVVVLHYERRAGLPSDM
jgi:hypothetical protein